jgi:hypothetical protein
LPGCQHEASFKDDETIINSGTGTVGRLDASVFVLEQVFGGEQEIIGRILSMTTDTAENLYLLDAQSDQIRSYRPDGSLRWISAGRGEAPGELQYAWDITFDESGERLLVMNRHGTRIETFSTTGEHIGGYDLSALFESNFRLVGHAPPNLVVLSKPSSEVIGVDIVTLEMNRDESPSVMSMYTVDQGDGLSALPVPILSADVRIDGEALFSSNLVAYRLDRYSFHGDALQSIRRGENHLLGPAFSGRPPLLESETYSGISAPLRLSSGHLIVVAWWPDNVSRREDQLTVSRRDAGLRSRLDVFDADGRFVGSSETSDSIVPDLGWPMHASRGGYLYMWAETPYPQVHRYRVRIPGN